jgi:hypothetical protein
MISTYEFNKNVYARIFALDEKLTNLTFDTIHFCQPSLSFNNLLPNTCHSSTLVYLNITVSTLDDCLTLLDGRLPELSSFHVVICQIDQSLIDNTVKIFKKYFYFSNGTLLCNVFSFPFTMDYLYGVTNNFSGGIFPSVYYMTMLDVRPFDENNRINSSIIVYPNLITLYLLNVHLDYLEEFLHDNNARLPSLKRLEVKYEQLLTVTNNFTNKKTRQNCAHLKFLEMDNVTVYPKDFYSYFPLL